MKEMFATITGFAKCGGLAPFKLGGLVRCEKEPDNAYDGEAIKCTLPLLGAVGYIANSTSTVVGGTMSAGRLYDKVDSKFYVRVLFMTHSSVICRVENGEPDELAKELMEQYDDGWDCCEPTEPAVCICDEDDEAED